MQQQNFGKLTKGAIVLTDDLSFSYWNLEPKDRREKGIYYSSTLDDIGDIYLSLILANAFGMVEATVNAFSRDGAHDWLWKIIGINLLLRIISFCFRTSNKRQFGI